MRHPLTAQFAIRIAGEVFWPSRSEFETLTPAVEEYLRDAYPDVQLRSRFLTIHTTAACPQLAGSTRPGSRMSLVCDLNRMQDVAFTLAGLFTEGCIVETIAIVRNDHELTIGYPWR